MSQYLVNVNTNCSVCFNNNQTLGVCCNFVKTLQRFLIHERDRHDEISEFQNCNLDVLYNTMIKEIVNYLITTITHNQSGTPDTEDLFNMFFSLKKRDFEIIVHRAIQSVQSNLRMFKNVDDALREMQYFVLFELQKDVASFISQKRNA